MSSAKRSRGASASIISSMFGPMLATFTGLTAGCGVEFLDDESANVPEPVVAAFERSCATVGCHRGATASEGLVLDEAGIRAAMQRQATQVDLPLITLGDRNKSYLALKILAPNLPAGTSIEYSQMPPAPSATSQADVAVILQWISGDSTTTTTTTTSDSDTEECLPPPMLADGAKVQVSEIVPIVAARCSGYGCHSAGGTTTPVLDTGSLHDNLVNAKVASGAQGNYVVPGDLAASYLWHKLNDTHLEVRGGSGVRMPVGAPLCADELATIKAWIVDGALP